MTHIPLSATLRHAMSSRLHANSLYLMMNSVVTAGLGFFFWALVARLYSARMWGLARR